MSRTLTWLKPIWPGPEAILAGFERPKHVRLRLERFPRGVDSYHIDVAFGSALTRATEAFVKALVREQAQQLWKQPAEAFSESIVDAFRHAVVDHHNAVVKQARSDNRIERVQLFELSMLKVLLEQVDAELKALRVELEDARSTPSGQLSGKSLHYHQQAVVLARQSWHFRYRVARQAVRELTRIEHTRLRKVRKSVLGLSWPLPEPFLVNPMLQFEGAGDARDFSRLYPLVLHDIDAAARINRCVLELFDEWLPAAVEMPPATMPAESFLPGVNRQDKGSARSLLETERRVRQLFVESELNHSATNWMDEPDNASALLGGTGDDWPAPCGWRQSGISGLQRQLNARFERRLRQVGALAAVKASYELSAVYAALGLVDAEALLFDFLKGDIGRAEMKRRLSAVEGVGDPGGVLRRIDQLRKDYAKEAEAGRRQMVARFAADFLRFRRDLKLAWRALVGMDAIRLVVDERDQALAMDNGTLQVFCREDVVLGARGSVVGHVIIKVDIRGASEITAQMRRRNMNAASHFSRYFFDPITRSLERFGAQKVAVDGDAVMLAVLEYGGESVAHMAVAHASCLAMKIIGFVDGMNAENERIGLPPLEVGLGLAYADEPPTYLYDHGRKVTISPAIGVARELSSCHALLRQSCSLPGGRGLCVVAPVQGEQDVNESLVRYNINGIELDPAAFAQLHVELSMRRLSTRDRQSSHREVLFAGICADALGESHLLVVRERRIKLWMGKQLLDTHDDGRRFYEVVTDARLLGRVSERLAGEKEFLTAKARDARLP